jgi:HSP20 family protein
MKTQTALEPKSQTTSPSPFIIEAEKLLERMQELSQNVAHRAFEFFEARGGEWGHALEDWLRAESDLLRYVPVEISETDKQFRVRAEVPGFSANEIQVSVEPKSLIINGKSESKAEEQKEQTVYNERRSRQFCRAIELSAEVEPQRTSATLKDGVLELTLDKAVSEPTVNVEVKPV